MLALGTVGLFQGVVDTVIERFARRVLVRLLSSVFQPLLYGFFAWLRKVLDDDLAGFQLYAEAAGNHGGGEASDGVGRIVRRLGAPFSKPRLAVDIDGGGRWAHGGVLQIFVYPLARSECSSL